MEMEFGGRNVELESTEIRGDKIRLGRVPW